MSIKLMTCVWELELPHAQLLVSLALADHGNDDGSSIYPSVALIAWKCGYSDRQVQRIIRQLEDAGLLVKVADAVGHRPIEYRMNIEAGAPKAPWTPDNSSGRHFDAPTSETSGVTKEHPRGDIAMSPEPSEEPSGNLPANAGVAAAPPPAERSEVDVQADRLCSLMSDHVRASHGIAASSKEARVAKTWPAACRSLLTVDRSPITGEPYTPAQIEYAIAWVCRHHYWRNRIKSMTRLRSEMEQVAKDLHDLKQRNQATAGRSNGQMAGLSASQRARMERSQRRLSVVQTNPQEDQPHEHHRIESGRSAGDGTPVPQRALTSRAGA